MSNETKTFRFKVDMTCEGCVNSVKRCLQKALGDRLKSVDTDLTTKTVTLVVDTSQQSYTADDIFATLQKTGKAVEKLE